MDSLFGNIEEARCAREQFHVLHVRGLWSRECRHLDSHPSSTAPPSLEQSGFPPDQQEAYEGANYWWQGSLRPEVGGADGLKSAGTIQSQARVK